MNLDEWKVGQGGHIYYKGQEYHDNKSFVFGPEIFKELPDGINNIDAFIEELPGWTQGDEVNTFNGRPKTEYINDVITQINQNLGWNEEIVNGEATQVFNNNFSPKIYENLAMDYLRARSNNNPSRGQVQRMISNPGEYSLNPGEDSKIKKDWDEFIANQGWENTDYAEYNFKNYALWQVLDKWYTHVGAENMKLDNGKKLPFTITNVSGIGEFQNESVSVNALNTNPELGGDPNSGAPVGKYSFNSVYNHGEVVSNMQIPVRTNNQGVLNVFFENAPLPNNSVQDGELGLHIDNINIDAKGSWQHIDGVVVKTLYGDDGEPIGTRFLHADDVAAEREAGSTLEYVPMVRVNLEGAQIKKLFMYTQQSEGARPDETAFELWLRKLQDNTKYTVHVPLSQMMENDNQGWMNYFDESDLGSYFKEFNDWLGTNPVNSNVNQGINDLL